MELYLLNKKFEMVDVVDVFESIIWTDRYSKYGDFEIYTTPENDLVKKLKTDYYLWSAESEHTMIIEDRKIETDVETGPHLIISGRSLESILYRRIVWDQINLDGYIEDEIERLLDVNIINPSDQNRKIENFVFQRSEDSFIESLKIQGQFTGDPVYDVIKKLCDSVDIGFKLILNNDDQFAFQLYSGMDRSYDQIENPYVVFSPNFENIINSNYYETKKDLKTITLVGGEGEGTSRKTAVVGDTEMIGLDRRELFTDARDISSYTDDGEMSSSQYEASLKQRGIESLAQNKIIQSFDGEVEATQLYIYGRDFFMGDTVQLESQYGMNSKVRIVEYIYSQDVNSGVSSYPTFEVLEEEVG